MGELHEAFAPVAEFWNEHHGSFVFPGPPGTTWVLRVWADTSAPAHGQLGEFGPRLGWHVPRASGNAETLRGLTEALTWLQGRVEMVETYRRQWLLDRQGAAAPRRTEEGS